VSERLLTAREVGELLGISPRTVLAWTRAGQLPGVKLPSGAVRYRGDELDGWLLDHATGRADGTDEKSHQPDAPSAPRQDTAATLRPSPILTPGYGVTNEKE
jgi:excisionase family DNA binding protein